MGTSGEILFRKLDKGTGKAKPWHLRFSPSGWHWTRRPAKAAKGTSSVERKRWRRLGSLLLSFLRNILFRVVEAVEAVVLVAGMCFFFFRFGCRL